MVINNVQLADSGAPVHVRISNGKISEVSDAVLSGKAYDLELNMDRDLIFPGLVNSHDHLDFNLYPKLGDKQYSNYTEWGEHIHLNYKKEITDIQKIPFLLRHTWGIYKNLFCGVTTVINHGERTGLRNSLITVFENSQSLHSVHLEKYWKLRLNNPLKVKQPVNIHIGEGGDWLAFHEIDELISFNLLHRKLIGTHAVAMTAEQAEKFEAIIWCPESNYFLLDKTAQIDVLEEHTKILFGTDSTLTGSWDIWEHLRLARKTRLLSDASLYQSLNDTPADVWQLNTGIISSGKDADLVIARPNSKENNLEAFFSITPADILLVIHQGEIRLFDERLLPQLRELDLNNYSRILLADRCKYIEGDLPELISKIKRYNPEINFPVSANLDISA